MGTVFHILEQDAARDLSRLLRRVRGSDTVVIDCGDGAKALLLLEKPGGGPEGRTIAEAQEILRVRRQTKELAIVDADFAADMGAVHALYNEPMQSSPWD